MPARPGLAWPPRKRPHGSHRTEPGGRANQGMRACFCLPPRPPSPWAWPRGGDRKTLSELLSPLELVLSPDCVTSGNLICPGPWFPPVRASAILFVRSYHFENDTNDGRIPNTFPVLLKRMRKETGPSHPLPKLYLALILYLFNSLLPRLNVQRLL